MALRHLSYFLFVLFLNRTQTQKDQYMPEIQEKDFNMRSHLKYDSVWEYCTHRDNACRSNTTNICAVKQINGKKFYKDFMNGCYLFLSNMCDHPEDEYFIVTSGNCEVYLALRRSDIEGTTDIPPENEGKNTTNTTNNNVTQKSIHKTGHHEGLRMESEEEMQNYSYNGKPCPHSCPDIYAPMCVNINRGHGKYFKLLTFVNHCESYLYYCKHIDEFKPVPDEYENVRASLLAWSFCGHYRYLNFARFSESASSMNHYGWLNGPGKYSKILGHNQNGYGG